MNIKISLVLLLILFFLSSCQDVVDLEVPDGEVQLVVDGWLTNQTGEKQVMLSTTANYFDNSTSPLVENAFVVLNDDEGPVGIDTDEPLGIGDHYRWKQYVNDEYRNEPFDLLYASDEFVDGNPIINFEVTINEPLEFGDRYRIQQLSISEEAFEFFGQLQTQTAFVGSLFDSPPAALNGNIVNLDSSGKKALGYFGVSAVSEKEMVIE